jgi:hypothetical protein
MAMQLGSRRTQMLVKFRGYYILRTVKKWAKLYNKNKYIRQELNICAINGRIDNNEKWVIHLKKMSN